MFAAVIPEVLAKYGITFVSIGNVQKGYRNESYAVQTTGGDIVNLIFFKNEPAILERITRADHASGVLGATMPVRVRHDPRLLKVKDGVYAGLYTYLPGTTVPWEAYTKKHIKLTGFAMADMHRLWRTAIPADAHTIGDDVLPLIGRMERYFEQTDVQAAMIAKLDVRLDPRHFPAFTQLVHRVLQLPGQQIIHMDMVRGNVLFRESQAGDRWSIDDLSLSGVIDFEKSTVGHPAFDVARTLAFLLVDSPKPPSKIYHYFLDSGYRKRGGGIMFDPELLTALIKLFLVHDFYKFLRHTPYESLHENRHYIRTRDILQTYGMIYTIE